MKLVPIRVTEGRSFGQVYITSEPYLYMLSKKRTTGLACSAEMKMDYYKGVHGVPYLEFKYHSKLTKLSEKNEVSCQPIIANRRQSSLKDVAAESASIFLHKTTSLGGHRRY